MKRPMIFRKFSQAFGVLLVCIGLRSTWLWLTAAIAGQVSLGWAVLFGVISLGAVSGLGLLFIFMDPHLVIHYYHNLHLLVKPTKRSQSFADRIGAGDDDE